MTLILSDSTALALAAQILANSRERAEALSRVVAAQGRLNGNPNDAANQFKSSTVQFPLTDAEVLADAVAKAGRLCAEKVIEL